MKPDEYLTSDLPLLPHRFRESSFRRYEPTITSAVAMFPNVKRVNPLTEFALSPVTFSNRLRDAMRSLADNKWSPTTVNMQKFLRVHPEIQVAERGRFVLIGDKDLILAADPAPIKGYADESANLADNPSPSAHILIPDFIAETTDDLILTFVIRGCHNRVYPNGVKVRPLYPHEIEQFESAYDIAVTQHSDHCLIQ